jgi:hypothetical protein
MQILQGFWEPKCKTLKGLETRIQKLNGSGNRRAGKPEYRTFTGLATDIQNQKGSGNQNTKS